MAKKWHKQKKKPGSQLPAQAVPAGTALEALGARLTEANADGRDRRAWPLAKELVGLPGATPEVWGVAVCDALVLRVRRMLAERQQREAFAMVAAFAQRHAAWAALLPPAFCVMLELRGGPLARLLAYRDERQASPELRALIETELRDPHWLATDSRLPEDHVLVGQARLVCAAWRALEEEAPEAETALAALGGIPRSSPLAPWRLFVQALAAFYAGDDERCRANLARIAPGAGAARGACLLTDLLAGRASDAPGSAALCGAVFANDLRTCADQTLAMLDGRSGPAFLSRVNALIAAAFRLGRHGLGLDLGLFCIHRRHFDDWSLDFMARHLPVLDVWRWRFMVRHERADRWPAMGWTVDELLDHDRSLTPIELALARRTLATVSLGLEYDQIENDDIEFVRKQFAASVQALPLQTTFAEWLTMWQRLEQDQREVARLWSRAFPDDERPLLVLLDDARGREDMRGIEAMLGALGRVAKGHDALECRRPFATGELAMMLARKGQHGDAMKWLDALSATDGWGAVVAASAAYLLAPRRTKTACGKRLASLAPPLAIWFCFGMLLGRKAQTTDLPACVRDAVGDPTMFAEALRLLGTLRDPRWATAVYELFFAAAPGKRLRDADLTREQVIELLDAMFAMRRMARPHAMLDVGFALLRKAWCGKVVATDAGVGETLAFQAWIAGEGVQCVCSQLNARGCTELAEMLSAAAFLVAARGGDTARVERIATALGAADHAARAGKMSAKRAAQTVAREAKRCHYGYYHKEWGLADIRPSGARRQRFDDDDDDSQGDDRGMDRLREMIEQLRESLGDACPGDVNEPGAMPVPPPRRAPPRRRAPPVDPRQPFFDFFE